MKKLYLGMIMAFAAVMLVTAGVIAYQMLIVRSHINIVESQTLQYQDETGWHDFPLNTGTTLDLGLANMSAGDYSTFYVRGINPNNRPIMYVLQIDSNYTDLQYAVRCQEPGTQYAVMSGGAFGEGLTVAIRNEADSTATLGIDTNIDAGASITTDYPITPTTSVSRMEVGGVEAWNVCPTD